MTMYRVLNQHIVSEAEFVARSTDLKAHFEARAMGSKVAPLELSGGKQLTAAAPGTTPTIPILPIGPGLPLSIVILHVYTGKYPERSIFKSRGDMAIVSGVKNFTAVNASARAINYLQSAIAPHSHFVAPSVFDQGTPLIMYSPAVVDKEMIFTVEMATANDFVRNLLEQIGGGFQGLAGIPLLLPYAGYLLGGNALLKLGEGIADALYQSVPAFKQQEVVNFDNPFIAPSTSEVRVICNKGLAATNYIYKDKLGLVDAKGAQYDGDEPYVVVGLDGAQRDEWKGFTPAVASAAVLQKFFTVKTAGQTVVDTIVGAATVYSDLKYRQLASSLKAKIDATPPPANKDDLQKQYDAAVKNIVEPTMVPKP